MYMRLEEGKKTNLVILRPQQNGPYRLLSILKYLSDSSSRHCPYCQDRGSKWVVPECNVLHLENAHIECVCHICSMLVLGNAHSALWFRPLCHVNKTI